MAAGKLNVHALLAFTHWKQGGSWVCSADLTSTAAVSSTSSSSTMIGLDLGRARGLPLEDDAAGLGSAGGGRLGAGAFDLEAAVGGGLETVEWPERLPKILSLTLAQTTQGECSCIACLSSYEDASIYGKVT